MRQSSFATPLERSIRPARPILMSARPSVVVLAAHHVKTAAGYVRGGAEKYIRGAVSALLDANANVHVNFSGDTIYHGLTPLREGQRLILEKSDWLDAKWHGDARLNWRVVAARMRWLLDARPDVLFVVQQNHGTAFAASILAAAIIGIPVVMSVRQMPLDESAEMDLGAPRGRFGLWRRVPALRMNTVTRCCRTVIFNSRRVADSFAERYGLPASRVCVIPNGEPLAAAPRSRLKPDPRLFFHPRRADRVMMGSIGQIASHKGADLTLEAFSQIADRHPKAELIYFGEGPTRATLEARAAALGLSHRVTFAGYTAERERAFANIDLFVLPSRRESSSNAVAEAMARGLPCIVSDVGGLPELIEDQTTGRVVPTENVSALSTAMSELTRNAPLRDELGDAAFAHAARHFNPDDAHHALLETLLPQRPR